MQLIRKYFPDLERVQVGQFEKLLEILPSLNKKVNVISRKDVDFLEERHILHSLSIGMKFRFRNKTSVIDVGTGGGFPGIPLAILYPETRFLLVDSIGKKIRLVQEISETLKLQNVTVLQERMEKLNATADFVISRAVTAFPVLYNWTHHLIKPGDGYRMANGLISLKGGDLDEELGAFKSKVELYPISAWFDESFFYTKMIVYLKK